MHVINLMCNNPATFVLLLGYHALYGTCPCFRYGTKSFLTLKDHRPENNRNLSMCWEIGA